MNPAYVIAGVQIAILVLLTLDRWVHRVTGAPSIEARMANVERMVEAINKRASESAGVITSKVVNIEGDVREIKAQITAMVKAADSLERRVDHRRS